MKNSATEKTILIGYHQRLLAEGIKAMVTDFCNCYHVELIENGRNLFKQLQIKKYDLLIIDLVYPGCTSLEYLSEIKRTFRSQRILLISDLIQNGMLVDLINTGVEGYILHHCNDRDLENAINKISANEQYICTTITATILRNLKEAKNQDQNIKITKREKEILTYLVKMHSNKGIAEKLNISELTVKTHRKNLMKKFGSKNLLALVRYVCRENLINGEDDEFCMGCPHKSRYKLHFN